MLEYTEILTNMKLLLSDVCDEFIEFKQKDLDELSDTQIFAIYDTLANMQSYLLSNLVRPIQEKCEELGEILLERQKS